MSDATQDSPFESPVAYGDEADQAEHRIADRLMSILGKIETSDGMTEEEEARAAEAAATGAAAEEDDEEEDDGAAVGGEVREPPAPPQAKTEDQDLSRVTSIALQWQERAQAMERQLAEVTGETTKLKADTAELAQYRAMRTKLEEHDVIGALGELGFNVKDVVAAIADDRGVSPGKAERDAHKREVDELKSKFQAMEDEKRQRAEAAEQERLARETYKAIDDAVLLRSPLLKALGTAGQQSVLFAMEADFQASGRRKTPTVEDGVAAAEKHWDDLLRTVLNDPALRQRYVASGKPGATAKQPATIDTAVTSERTSPKKKPSVELSDDERAEQVWNSRGKAKG